MAIFNVSTAAQLNTALLAAKGGDMISLAAGNYGAVRMSNVKPDSMVVIKSADEANPAHFDTLLAHYCQNLTFKGLDIGRPLAAGEPDYTQMAAIRFSSTIVFDGNFVHGSLDGNAQNDSYGLLADKVTALTITNNRFEQLARGAIVSETTNLQVSHNKFFDMRSDGLDVDGIKNAVIEHNVFKGFYPLDFDHPDAIQMHNIGYDAPTENVTIRNNMLLPGGAYSPQGVWVSDPDKAGFKNIVIENNILWGKGSYNGIGLNGVVGGRVIGNTVLSPTDDAKVMWIRVRNSTDVDMIRNVSEDIILEGTNNSDIQIIDSVNLRLSPQLRALMANPENPAGWGDLLMPNAGVSQPYALSAHAPVSGAVGTALVGQLSTNQGQSLVQAVPVAEASVAGQSLSLLSGLIAPQEPPQQLTQLVGSVAVHEEPSLASQIFSASSSMVEPQPMPLHGDSWRNSFQDWWVALP